MAAPRNSFIERWYTGTGMEPINPSGFLTPAASDVICHYGDVIMGVLASQITSLTIVYSTIHSGADQRKHQSSASLAFVRGIHRWPVNSPHKWSVTRKMFPFDDVIMALKSTTRIWNRFSWNSNEVVYSYRLLNSKIHMPYLVSIGYQKYRKIEKQNIGEKWFGSRYYLSPTWTIYNRWQHSWQQGPSSRSATSNIHHIHC